MSEQHPDEAAVLAKFNAVDPPRVYASFFRNPDNLADDSKVTIGPYRDFSILPDPLRVVGSEKFTIEDTSRVVAVWDGRGWRLAAIAAPTYELVSFHTVAPRECPKPT